MAVIGAIAGTVVGGTIGAVVGGPLGAIVGADLGGLAGTMTEDGVKKATAKPPDEPDSGRIK